MQQKDKLMGEGKLIPLLIRFSLPAVVGMAVNSMYSITDRIFVGNCVGKTGLSIITAVFPVTTVIMALSVLNGMGCSTLIAIRLGQGDEKSAQNVLNHSIIYIITVAGISSVLGNVFLKPILTFIGIAPEIMEYALPYARIIISFSCFTYVAFGLNHSIRSSGRPIVAMVSVLIGGGLNILFDYIFLVKAGFGLEGAAWANAISQGVASTFIIIYFIKSSSVIKINFRGFKLNFKQIFEIIKIGSAQSLMQLITAIITIILNKIVVSYISFEDLGASGIYLSTLNLLTVSAMGISQGAQSLIGYNYGAKNKKRVLGFYYLALVFAVTITAGVTIIILMFAPGVAGLFGKTPSFLAIEWIKKGLFLTSLSACTIVSTGYFQAKGKQGLALAVAMLRQVVFYVPMIFALPKFFGINGVIYAQPVSDVLSATVVMIIVIYDIKKYRNDKRRCLNEG